MANVKSTTGKIPASYLISFKNGTTKKLVYSSSRTVGYNLSWPKPTPQEPDSVDQMEFQEAISMRNTNPKFFRENWIIPVADEKYTVEEFLKQIGVLAYYKNYIDTDNINELFDKNNLEIENTIMSLPHGQKEIVYLKAVEMYKDGTLADLNKIRLIERIYGRTVQVDMQPVLPSKPKEENI